MASSASGFPFWWCLREGHFPCLCPPPVPSPAVLYSNFLVFFDRGQWRRNSLFSWVSHVISRHGVPSVREGGLLGALVLWGSISRYLLPLSQKDNVLYFSSFAPAAQDPKDQCLWPSPKEIKTFVPQDRWRRMVQVDFPDAVSLVSAPTPQV